MYDFRRDPWRRYSTKLGTVARRVKGAWFAIPLKVRGLIVPVVVLALLAILLWCTGCTGSMRMLQPDPPNSPTTQPAPAAAAIGAVATSVASQIEAKLTGLEFNRTVDHALDGGQLLVLLAVIYGSHRREMMRIKRNAKEGC